MLTSDLRGTTAALQAGFELLTSDLRHNLTSHLAEFRSNDPYTTYQSTKIRPICLFLVLWRAEL